MLISQDPFPFPLAGVSLPPFLSMFTLMLAGALRRSGIWSHFLMTQRCCHTELFPFHTKLFYCLLLICVSKKKLFSSTFLFLPERRHPHAAAGRLPLKQGKCIFPSCHKSPSQSQSFPEREEKSHWGVRPEVDNINSTECILTAVESHLSVYVAISVNVIQVERPLQLFSQCSSQQCRQTHHKILTESKQKIRSDPNMAHGRYKIKHKMQPQRQWPWLYLELNGAVICGVKRIEEIMCVHACVCNTETWLYEICYTLRA